MSTTLTTPEPGTDRVRRTLSAGLALAGAAITFTNIYVAGGRFSDRLRSRHRGRAQISVG